jgi:hypothetical protein
MLLKVTRPLALSSPDDATPPDVLRLMDATSNAGAVGACAAGDATIHPAARHAQSPLRTPSVTQHPEKG